jgi:hypothetical protein
MLRAKFHNVRSAKASGYNPEHDVPYELVRKAVMENAFRLEVPTERHIALEMDMHEPILEFWKPY